MEEYRVGQLTKEMVITRLKALGDPCVAAAEIAKKTMVVGLTGSATVGAHTRQLVKEICHGTMVGLIMADQSLPKGACLLLRVAAEVSSDLSLNPEEMMTYAIEGIVELRRLSTVDQMEDIRKAVSRDFMGAGDVFRAALDKVEETLRASAEGAQTRR